MTIGCHHTPTTSSDASADAGTDGGTSDAGPSTRLSAKLVDTRFHVAEEMRAAIELQVSGEPFAQLLGYNLAGFNRQLLLTDQYKDPVTSVQRTDPLGYALAIESYEYSKQPMNNLSFESGAGLSLMFGPVLNPLKKPADAGVNIFGDRFEHFALAANAGGLAGTNLIVTPRPQNNPLNIYGWPGLWPVMAEFASFDPTIDPYPGTVNTCTFSGSQGAFAYGGPVTPNGPLIANYECDYNSLNLRDRDGQVDKHLEPDALGYAAWKQGLWVINYWQTLQDSAGNGITEVNPGDLAQVGKDGNTVIGRYPDPSDPIGLKMLDGAPGVFLGDIPMEGWQGLLMIEEIDNKAALLLGQLVSSDGTTLVGTTTLAADNYAYDSPLIYFPGSIAVTETPASTNGLRKYFPLPSAFTIASGASRLAGLSGLIGGFAEAFAFTDRSNPGVGGSFSFEATFDGDPFPLDDGQPSGENTLHDRALGVLKIALVDLDRLHFDSNAKVLVDTASVNAGMIVRGTKVTTVELAEAIVALRNAFRALNGSLQLYSNDTPDTQGAAGALDRAPLTGANYSGTLENHLVDLIRAEADFLVAKMLNHGAVTNSYDLASNASDSAPTTLESETAAIRALLEAYLATSAVKYRDRAIEVYADLSQRFWMDDVRAFQTTAGVRDRLQYTPLRFGMLSGALRQYYKLVGSAPSRATEGAALLAHLKRMHKLVLNGWDDRNQDDALQFPEECLGAGLEMGERTLTGELGHPADLGDRDKDCVKELSYVDLPAALGAELDFVRQ